MTSQGMVLRNMALVGGTTSAVLSAEQRPVFELGVRLLFERWTAVQLAVANEWGGSRSADKARELLEDVVEWFYAKKNHEMLDLEELLDEALQVEFHVQAEDDSPYQLARSLVNMHNQVAAGDTSYVEQLQATPNPLQQSLRASQGEPGAEVQGEDAESSSSDDEETGEGGSGSDEEMGEAVGMDADAPAAHPEPAVDEDGFTSVIRRRGGRR